MPVYYYQAQPFSGSVRCSSDGRAEWSEGVDNNKDTASESATVRAAIGGETVKLEFALPSGSYATAFLRELLCNDDLI